MLGRKKYHWLHPGLHVNLEQALITGCDCGHADVVHKNAINTLLLKTWRHFQAISGNLCSGRTMDSLRGLNAR